MLEKQNIEYKEIWKDEYLKWVCGFANAKGGKIVIGKKDDGEIVGVKNAKKLMEDIPNKIQHLLGVICDVNLEIFKEKSIIEIDVKPYTVPISYQGKYHFRSGSTKQELKGNSLNEFLLKKVGKTWDDVVESKAKLDDIDETAIEVFKKAATNSKRLPFIKDENDLSQILDNLLLLDSGELKRSAILLFGKNPCRYFINAYAKIGRFGATDDDLRFQEVVESNAFELPDKILEVLDRKFLISPISYNGLHRIEGWEYPYEAIREIIINAVVHKDYMGAPIQISVYDDKIMFWNEGKLPEDISIDALKRKHPSRPRNPILAGAFFKGGLIESWGRGIQKVVSKCVKLGLPEPIFQEIDGGILVTVFKSKKEVDVIVDNVSLNVRQQKAIEYLKAKGKITNKIYQEINDASRRTATRDLKELIENNLIKSQGTKGAGAYYILK